MLSYPQVPTAEGILQALCGSGTRFRILRALFERPLEPLSLTDIARAAGSDAGNALRLLRTLVEAGVVEAAKTRSTSRYRPRRDTPIFHQLCSLFAADNFPCSGRSIHAKLDEHKRRIGELILERRTLKQVRTKALQNLKRWQAKGVWNDAYEDWKGIIEHGSDAQLVHAMTGRDEQSNRLRQSMPYVGLLDRNVVRMMNEKIAA